MTQLMSALLLAVALQGPSLSPQQQPKASIEGIVVRAGTSEPVGRAQITITPTTLPGAAGAAGQRGAAPTPNPQAAPGQPAAAGGAANGASVQIMAESDGKFVIKDLAPGTYRLYAARNGYSKQELGQRSLRGPGTPVVVQAGQTLKDVTFRLTPAGTINGRVTDSMGEPLAGITVQLLRSTYGANGKRTFANVTNTKTNDLGEYRLYWITPGQYYLNANPSGGYVQTLVQAQINSQASAVRAQDTNGNAANAVAAAMEALLGLNANEVVEPGYAITYYPGTTDGSRAAPVAVQPGTELRAIDFALVRERTFHVQGRVFDTRTGQAPETAVVQMALVENPGGALPKNGSYDPTNGAFEFREVPAGNYIVVAVVQGRTGPSAGLVVSQINANINANVEGLVLNVRPGISVAGQVAVENGNVSSIGGVERMRIRLVPAVDTLVNVAQPPAVKDDGTFVMENVSPGDYRLALVAPPANVYLKEARFGGTDLLRDNVAVTESGGGSFQIVLSANGGQITGTLVDKDSKPVPATQVVLVPDRQRDRRELFKATNTDQSGRFTLLGIPPGDYKVFAWDEIEPFAFTDPEILRQYEPQAKAVRIGELSKETFEMKVIPATQ
jgi:hypothetical protein